MISTDYEIYAIMEHYALVLTDQTDQNTLLNDNLDIDSGALLGWLTFMWYGVTLSYWQWPKLQNITHEQLMNAWWNSSIFQESTFLFKKPKLEIPKVINHWYMSIMANLFIRILNHDQ